MTIPENKRRWYQYSHRRVEHAAGEARPQGVRIGPLAKEAFRYVIGHRIAQGGKCRSNSNSTPSRSNPYRWLLLQQPTIPDVVVVMMSVSDNPTYIARAVAWGASDFVLKGSSRDDIIATIIAAGRGESPSRSGELLRIAAIMKIRLAIDDEDVPLTPRETQVLRHIALGLSNKEIGRSLEISAETVKEHVQSVLRKIAVSDRTQAAVWAVRKGLV